MALMLEWMILQHSRLWGGGCYMALMLEWMILQHSWLWEGLLDGIDVRVDDIAAFQVVGGGC